jgi:hypothetical protein
MGFFNNIYHKAECYFLKNADERNLRVHAVAKSDGAKSKLLVYESETLQAQTLKDYKTAILMATDPEEPNKSMLWTLYKNLLLDNHLSSVIDSRILFCQRSTIKIVNEAGEENPDLTWLFERTWHEEVIALILRLRTEGVKLFEMYDLNPLTGELETVTEIPMPYFNAKKGIIVKTPGDSTGWPYKEGELANYYVQVGKDDDLGMLAEMAPVVLAKKLGFGSWLDYIEKYGVGNLFITTDREDDERLKELYQAAKNFKSSGFMVGRGQEKFEIKGGDAGNPQNFDLLITRVNDEISKRLLGGSGLTDEKAFVGSAEIQFRLAKDRFESDKMLVKNVYNQHIIPRLIKLSPVYAPLQGHYFEWDNSETQTLDEIIKLVTTLAPYFELDIEEISQKTGLTIIGQKSGTATAEETEIIKKKSVIGK